ncbi:MAG: FAD-dependent oxidoreductase [Anaerolineales bacterium]|nr:FAD-dependent oxidoreductase [Anaerolineales bacterium]
MIKANGVVIDRDIQRASDAAFDLIVIGGGIQGVFVALQSSLRGLRPLLLERQDFGHATSGSSLRILHGGLRYLQSFSFRRILASVAERRWFSRHFPGLVEPLPCLMPLYGSGLRRASLMKGALALNDLLSVRRNAGVPSHCQLPRGRVIDVAATKRLHPHVREKGLEGAALWYDAVMPSSERVLMEILRWAVGGGATALNYTEVTSLARVQGRLCGVDARDRVSGRTLRFHAPVVINCGGPWGADIAGSMDTPPAAPVPLTLAFNVLLDRTPLSGMAVAVEAPDSDHTYFLLPWYGRTLVGTHYRSWEKGPAMATPSAEDVAHMLKEVSSALEGVDLGVDLVKRVYSGLLPSRGSGLAEPEKQDLIVDHGAQGGTRGFYTVIGVKYTTARRLAIKVLQRIYGRHRVPKDVTPPPISGREPPATDTKAWLQSIIARESVLYLDDLMLRRFHWTGDINVLRAGLDTLAEFHGWSRHRTYDELERLNLALDWGRTVESR